ncbi:carboxylic ester hydrolase [Favolaschia claudopus]|uniref:Carboxylic ester hydrolase n=1 Tax=Favolaschia claudopus TaxID=2862362 RepID=A0AAW0CG05_9AGAR
MRAPLLFATFLSTTLAQTAYTNHKPVVRIQNGTVCGVDLPQFNQSLFLGIPYAQPPVGDLRLRPPRSISKSFGELDATSYGPHCWSAFTTGFDDNSGYTSSEDCLTLNVIRPHEASVENLVPVIVWIHGGGFFAGGSADSRYNGTYLVQASVANGHPVVFVSINYRLASLGWMGGSALAEEGSLNLGLRDQRLALQWVQENIAKFGGNPRNVTVHGQSAGGMSIHAHIVAYNGRDDHLFTRAIIESGTIGLPYPPADNPISQGLSDSLVSSSSCARGNSSAAIDAESQLACLRALPIDEFLQAAGSAIFGTYGVLYDGDMITVGGPFAAYKAGKFVKVPMLIGSNTDEGHSFSPTGANTVDDIKLRLASVVPADQMDTLLDFYPDILAEGCPFNTGDFRLDPVQNGVFEVPGTQDKRAAAVVGDVVMAAGPRWLAKEISCHVPMWKYRFNHIPHSVSFGTQDYVGHFLEVAYVFNTQNNDTDFWNANQFRATYLGPGTPIEDRFLGVYMSRAWASFAATGDPNNAKVSPRVHWPQYSNGGKNIVLRTQGSHLEDDDFRSKGMDFIMANVFF